MDRLRPRSLSEHMKTVATVEMVENVGGMATFVRSDVTRESDIYKSTLAIRLQVLVPIGVNRRSWASLGISPSTLRSIEAVTV